MTEKQTIRKRVAELKSIVSREQMQAEADAVFSAIELDPVFYAATKVLAYWSLPDELPTHNWIKKWSAEKEFYLPVVDGNDMKIKRLMSVRALRTGTYGINEPAGEDFYEGELDLIIVPGVAFDRNRNRLGRGKGFYDRFFIHSNAPKYGVSANCQLIDCLPIDFFDVKMDKVFTPTVILE